jgi:hypothetical protein
MERRSDSTTVVGPRRGSEATQGVVAITLDRSVFPLLPDNVTLALRASTASGSAIYTGELSLPQFQDAQGELPENQKALARARYEQLIREIESDPFRTRRGGTLTSDQRGLPPIFWLRASGTHDADPNGIRLYYTDTRVGPDRKRIIPLLGFSRFSRSAGVESRLKQAAGYVNSKRHIR